MKFCRGGDRPLHLFGGGRELGLQFLSGVGIGEKFAEVDSRCFDVSVDRVVLGHE